MPSSSSMFYVYVLRCSDGSLYVGRTKDLAAREQWHNDGHGARYTTSRRPVTIVYAEEFSSELSAARRERQLKRWSTAKKNALVSRDPITLKLLSRTSRQPLDECDVVTWRHLLERNRRSS